jgi:hypothetical protein
MTERLPDFLRLWHDSRLGQMTMTIHKSLICHYVHPNDEIIIMENPPLWVWAVIIGIIIAGKFIYRWHGTKQLAKESQARKQK